MKVSYFRKEKLPQYVYGNDMLLPTTIWYLDCVRRSSRSVITLDTLKIELPAKSSQTSWDSFSNPTARPSKTA